jgi:hypothetical protein
MTECSRAAAYPSAQVYQASMAAATAALEKPHLRQPDTAQAGEPKNLKRVGFTMMAN